MAYQRTNWEDYPSTNTRVNANNLNHQEDGIVANENAIRTLNNRVQQLQNQLNETAGDIQGEIDDGGQATSSVTSSVNSILTNILMDGRFNMQERTPAGSKILNGSLSGDDPYRFSISAGGANHYTSNKTIRLEKAVNEGANAHMCSAHGSIGGTAEITITHLAAAGVYLLVLASYTVATGACHSTAMKLIATGAKGGSATYPAGKIVAIGSANPATVTLYDNYLVSIKNPDAKRICEFSLIRLM